MGFWEQLGLREEEEEREDQDGEDSDVLSFMKKGSLVLPPVIPCPLSAPGSLHDCAVLSPLRCSPCQNPLSTSSPSCLAVAQLRWVSKLTKLAVLTKK